VTRLPRQVAHLSHVAGIGCLAIDDRRDATLIRDDDGSPGPALPAGFELASVAEHAPLITGLTHDRKVVVYDLATRYLWTLGAGDTMADLADDGRHVATYNEGQLSIYTLDLAADRAGYEAALDAATNLRVDGTTAAQLVWPRD